MNWKDEKIDSNATLGQIQGTWSLSILMRAGIYRSKAGQAGQKNMHRQFLVSSASLSGTSVSLDSNSLISTRSCPEQSIHCTLFPTPSFTQPSSKCCGFFRQLLSKIPSCCFPLMLPFLIPVASEDDWSQASATEVGADEGTWGAFPNGSGPGEYKWEDGFQKQMKGQCLLQSKALMNFFCSDGVDHHILWTYTLAMNQHTQLENVGKKKSKSTLTQIRCKAQEKHQFN